MDSGDPRQLQPQCGQHERGQEGQAETDCDPTPAGARRPQSHTILTLASGGAGNDDDSVDTAAIISVLAVAVAIVLRTTVLRRFYRRNRPRLVAAGQVRAGQQCRCGQGHGAGGQWQVRSLPGLHPESAGRLGLQLRLAARWAPPTTTHPMNKTATRHCSDRVRGGTRVYP